LTRLLVVSGLTGWAGATILLAELPRISRRKLRHRLAPYRATGSAAAERAGPFSVDSFRELVGPLSSALGERLSKLFGVNEELAVRLARVHSHLDVASFRVRQVGWSTLVLVLALAAALALGLPAVAGLVLVPAAPLLAFLLQEQQLARTSARWQRRIFLELPVVAEQIAMLLSAGYSLGSALNRLAERGHGASARDLGRASLRMRQGVPEVEALREWARLVRVEALDRVVSVLALNSEASDLGRLVSAEARSIRRDVQRSLVETMERRGQQVWVPVTVATLVPGLIFLVVPFIQALRLFAGP
jgi:tight adherence protein C